MPGVDRASLHRQAQKPTDDEDEQRDVDRAVERAAVVGADIAVVSLDAISARDGRQQRAAQDLLRILRHCVIRARYRCTVGVCDRTDPG